MSTPKRIPLAARLTVLAGMVLIFISVAGLLSPTLTAAAQIAGGLVALAGVAWIMLSLRGKA